MTTRWRWFVAVWFEMFADDPVFRWQTIALWSIALFDLGRFAVIMVRH